MKSLPDEIRWLTSSQAEQHLDWALEQIDAGKPSLFLQKHLRKELSIERALRVAELATLRKRARTKFNSADQMFFTARSLEQATSEIVARYKAATIERHALNNHKNAHVWDLCCGAGSDALFLNEQIECNAFDIDPVQAFFAEANAERLNRPMEVQCCDVTAIQVPANVIVHIDPDRRVESKSTSIEHFQPGLEFLDSLADSGNAVSMKLAPASDVPVSWLNKVHLEWIGHLRECKQQIAWFGFDGYPSNADTKSKPLYSATILGNQSGDVVDQVACDEADLAPTQVGTIKRYLYEPHSAVLAAKLDRHLADLHGLTAISNSNCYLTSDQLVNRAALSAFEVLACLPLKSKSVKDELARIGAYVEELKYRAISPETANPFRKLKKQGDQGIVLILSPTQDGYVAVISRRITQVTDLQASSV